MTEPNPSVIANFLNSVHLGPSQSHKELTLWPLLRPSAGSEIPYICLAQALESGVAQVDEIGRGTVPHVALVNGGDTSVLVLFGEEIVGAKQNRVANASFLVAPKSRVVLDVSCVEQGRWTERPDASFSMGDHVVSSTLRKDMATRVERSRAGGGGFDADQCAVWSGVSARVGSMPNPSKTGAYRDYARSHQRDLDAMARHFRPVDGQVGFVAARGDRVEGVEVVGDPAVYVRVHDRLLHAYTIDALEGTPAGLAKEAGIPFLAPEVFLQRVASTTYESGPSLGQGTDLRLNGDVSGCALDCGGMIHLMAFPTPSRADHPGNDASRRGRTASDSGGCIRSRRWWDWRR